MISKIQAGALCEIATPYAPGDGFDVEYGDDDASQWSFFLEIEGDSMLPDFRPGDRVLIDPDVQPRGATSLQPATPSKKPHSRNTACAASMNQAKKCLSWCHSMTITQPCAATSTTFASSEP